MQVKRYVLKETGSTALMSLCLSIGMLVRMFLLPFAGAISDSINKKYIMVCMDAFRGVVMVIMGLLCLRGKLTVPVVIFSVILSSLSETIFSPAATTLILKIVNKDDLIQGQSIQNTLLSITNIVGNSLAGAIVVFLGIGPSILLNGISFILSAISEVFIKVPNEKHSSLSISEILNTVIEGGKYIISDHKMKILFFVSLCMNLFSAGIMPLLLPYVLNCGYEVDKYSLLSGLISAGGILVAYF